MIDCLLQVLSCGTMRHPLSLDLIAHDMGCTPMQAAMHIRTAIKRGIEIKCIDKKYFYQEETK